jgi:hypothetical protein
MSRQSELFDRAAECERWMQVTSDPDMQSVIRLLRDLWIALGNECEFLSERQLVTQISTIEEIQSSIMKNTAH